MSDLATLRLVVDASGAIRAVDQFGTASEKAGKQGAALEAAAARVGTILGGTFAAALALATKETIDSQRETAQLAAALRSTAGASGQTLDSLNEQAEALRKLTAATGGEIAEAQALLLTFTKIGGDVFPRATATVLDMAQALGTDARGAALQLGKALNDPVLGVTALAKAGVQFNDAQKGVIKSLVETNQLAAAQNIILAELETQVGGSAAAYRNTLGGALEAVRESFVELLDLGNGPRMQGFIENINILADGMGIFATQSELAFTRSNLAIRRNEMRAGGLLMGATRGMFGAGIAGQAAADVARYENDIVALEKLLEEQRNDMYAGIVGRAGARTGSPGLGGATNSAALATAAPLDLDAAEFAQVVGDALRLADAERALAQARINAQARQSQLTGEFSELVGEGETAVINFGDVVAGLPAQVSETERVLTEQLQLGAGQFARELLDGGLGSLPRLWDSFVGLGKEAIAQVFAKEFMDRIGSSLASTISEKLSGFLGGAGTPLAAFGLGLVSALQESARAAARVAEQMAASARSISDFARRATDGELSEEQIALRKVLEERDALARNVVAATGIRGFTGGFDEAGEVLETFIRAGTPKRGTYKAALDQLAALDEAYAANVDAIRRNIEALEEQQRAEEAAARAREIARQAASLTAFSDSLLLSGQSTLSPTAQLAEARRQYDAVLALAQGGDASAIDSLPETARTLLDASRAVFASGTRYADEFARVQEDVAAVIDQLTNTEDIVPATEDSILYVGDQIQVLHDDLIFEQQAQLAVQQEGFQAVTGALVEVRAALEQVQYTLKTGVVLEVA